MFWIYLTNLFLISCKTGFWRYIYLLPCHRYEAGKSRDNHCKLPLSSFAFIRNLKISFEETRQVLFKGNNSFSFFSSCIKSYIQCMYIDAKASFAVFPLECSLLTLPNTPQNSLLLFIIISRNFSSFSVALRCLLQ